MLLAQPSHLGGYPLANGRHDGFGGWGLCHGFDSVLEILTPFSLLSFALIRKLKPQPGWLRAMTSASLLFLVLGAFIGAGTAFLIFQLDTSWKKTLLIGANGGIIASFMYVYKVLELPIDERVRSLIILIVSLFVTVLVSVYLLAKNLQKNSDPSLRFSLLDILLGHSRSIEQYYEHKKKLVDSSLNVADFDKRVKEIEAREKILSKKETEIIGLQKKIDETIGCSLNIHLPINAKVPIDSRFIDKLPQFVNDYSNFSSVLLESVRDWKTLYSEDKYSDEEVLDGFFFHLCSYTSNYLLNSNKDVRVHIRCLKDGEYRKIISTVGKVPYTQSITPISSIKGMIFAAGQEKRSLIKSLNEAQHQEAEHDHIWQDYMTLVFDRFYQGGIPYLSMGISVKSKSSYDDLFTFLNYCKFEQLIQEQLIKIDELIDIKKVIYKETA